MRILSILVTLFLAPLVAACQSAGARTHGVGVPGAGGMPAGEQSVQGEDVSTTGWVATAGIRAAGKSIAAFRLEFPDPADLIAWFNGWSAGVPSLAEQQAETRRAANERRAIAMQRQAAHAEAYAAALNAAMQRNTCTPNARGAPTCGVPPDVGERAAPAPTGATERGAGIPRQHADGTWWIDVTGR